MILANWRAIPHPSDWSLITSPISMHGAIPSIFHGKMTKSITSPITSRTTSPISYDVIDHVADFCYGVSP